jgi:hypothetical protein
MPRLRRASLVACVARSRDEGVAAPLRAKIKAPAAKAGIGGAAVRRVARAGGRAVAVAAARVAPIRELLKTPRQTESQPRGSRNRETLVRANTFPRQNLTISATSAEFFGVPINCHEISAASICTACGDRKLPVALPDHPCQRPHRGAQLRRPFRPGPHPIRSSPHSGPGRKRLSYDSIEAAFIASAFNQFRERRTK